jgi:hypothetical protein
MRIGGMGLAWETRRRGSTVDFEVAFVPASEKGKNQVGPSMK